MSASDIALAQRLADAAGEAIRPHFRALADTESKADASPVTMADREAEQAMRQILKAEVPHDGVIGEEFGERRRHVRPPMGARSDRRHRSFIVGRPIFGTLIALVDRGLPGAGHHRPADRPRTLAGRIGPADPVQRPAGPHPAPAADWKGRRSPPPGRIMFDDHDGEHFMALIETVADGQLAKGMVYGRRLLQLRPARLRPYRHRVRSGPQAPRFCRAGSRGRRCGRHDVRLERRSAPCRLRTAT